MTQEQTESNFLYHDCDGNCDDCEISMVLEEMRDPAKVTLSEISDYLSYLVEVVIGLRAEIKDLKSRL